ncbi:glycosyltransferase [Methylobacterium oryzae]|uniref:glycosyltransferase n=1 Tax=Methylobacterium oryzae TaxID=334852 RepID=UPI003AF4DDB1
MASDRSGAAEKVRHGRTGFVVAPEIGPLAEAFAALRDDALTAALGAEAGRLARAAPLGLEAHTAALRALYAGLAESAAGAMQHPSPLARPQRS